MMIGDNFLHVTYLSSAVICDADHERDGLKCPYSWNKTETKQL